MRLVGTNGGTDLRLAETVTFGGGGLNRAAEMRDDPEVIKEALCDENARAIVFWRGKPLIDPAGPAALAGIAMDHPALALAVEPPLFLGCEEGAPRFAVDISAWEPAEPVETLGAFLDPSEQRHPDLPEGTVFAELRRVMTALDRNDAELAATAKALLNWHESHGYCSRCGAKSESAQAGWQRKCPACGASHFPRTDPVVIMLITHGNSVLMGRSPGWPEGMYSLLAGFVEPGETLEAAVRREVFEEAGVRVGEVRYLASQPWPFPASLMMGCSGHALGREITIDPKEIEDARWFTREEMTDVFAGLNPLVLPARKGAIAHFLLEHWLADRLD